MDLKEAKIAIKLIVYGGILRSFQDVTRWEYQPHSHGSPILKPKAQTNFHKAPINPG